MNKCLSNSLGKNLEKKIKEIHLIGRYHDASFFLILNFNSMCATSLMDYYKLRKSIVISCREANKATTSSICTYSSSLSKEKG